MKVSLNKTKIITVEFQRQKWKLCKRCVQNESSFLIWSPIIFCYTAGCEQQLEAPLTVTRSSNNKPYYLVHWRGFESTFD